MIRPRKETADETTCASSAVLPPHEELEPEVNFDETAETPSTGAEIDLADEAELPNSLRRGVAVIKSHWKHAPVGPGGYLLIGENGEVLYVGKAKIVRQSNAS